jgi:hypothetical protein
VDRSGTDAQRATIVGIRVTASELEDASIATMLGNAGVAAVIDDRIACAASQSIIDHGVTVISSGGGDAERFAWQRTVADERDAADTIAGCTGTRVQWFAALRRVSAFDWWYARENANGRILAPYLIGADTPMADLAPHRLYVIDATRLDASDALAIVRSVSDAVRESRTATLGTPR